jgi:hypothetical protein
MDNRYYKYGCPPLMNDGRFISNYIRSSTFDQYIRDINKIKSSHEFRNYIQKNGSTIMNNIKGYHRENNTCNVEGKCLPMSGSEVPKIDTEDTKKIWYEELLDETPSQLDFMMSNNNIVTNTNKPSNLTTRENQNNECTSCAKN